MPSKKRLLLFAYYFPPLGGAGSRRALSFARSLPGHGWEVVVVTPKEGVYGRDPSLQVDGIPGVRVVRTGTWEPSVVLRSLHGRKAGAPGARDAGEYVEEAELGAIGRAVRTIVRRTMYFPDSASGWIGPAVRAARRIHREAPVHAVLSSSPPVSAHAAAAEFGKAAGLPVILDFRDLWGPSLPGGTRKGARYLSGLLEGAAAVTTVSEGYAGWLRGAGARAGPDVVFNGWERSLPGAPGAGGPDVLHAGTTYGDRQDFGRVARVVEGMRKAGSPLVLRLVGSIDPGTRAALAPFVASGAAVIEPFQASGAVQQQLRGAAVILVVAWSGAGPEASGHLPAKLFDAVPAGRPVLLIADRGSEAERVGRRLGVRVVPPGDDAALREALSASLPVPFPEPEFSREVQAARLAGVLDRVAAEAGR